MQRQISYFGDPDSTNGSMKHVGDDETNLQVLSMLWDEKDADYHSYEHFPEWPEVKDEVFKDSFYP